MAKAAANPTKNLDPAQKKLLKALRTAGKPLEQDELIKKLTSLSADQIQHAITELVQLGEVAKLRGGRIGLIDKLNLVHGKIILRRDGALIRTDDGVELGLANRHAQAYFEGDRVVAREGERMLHGRPEAIVTEVLVRAYSQLSGVYRQAQNQAPQLIVDNKKVKQAFFIQSDSAENTAKDGDHIVCSITRYPTAEHSGEVAIIENLGQNDSPWLQTELAIRRHNLPSEWPAELVAQAEQLPAPSETDCKHRVDLRELPLMTIDGASARDFDDAVFACRKPKGGWRLWVAIADVSHYVPMESPLDLEAFNRSTSVYFPHRVVPMLPEQLSNELCSLKPNVDRLSLVCEMSISASGKISTFVFYEAIIRSHARLTYTQVGRFLSGEEAAEPSSDPLMQPVSGLDASITEGILDLYDLYQVLFAIRRERGALEFGTTETEMSFDDEGHIKAVVPVFRNDAHRLIEEMMLAANVCAAKVLRKHDMPALYRNHEPPTADKVTDLVSALQSFGAKPKFSGEPKPQDYLQFLERIADRADSQILQTIVLRSMNQARYESDCKGHFGLAYQAYTHFTSPIRRYPDLVIHRCLRYLIRNQDGPHVHRVKGAKKLRKPEWLLTQPKKLEAVAEQTSTFERRADDATREVVAWLKCAFMADHIGEEFDGHISGVTNFGLFITIDDLMIDGLLHVSSLDRDYYQFNPQTLQLVGERSGFTFKIGDPLRVLLSRVSLEDRKIDFSPVKSSSKGRSRSSAGKSKRGKAKSSNSSRRKRSKS